MVTEKKKMPKIWHCGNRKKNKKKKIEKKKEIFHCLV